MDLPRAEVEWHLVRNGKPYGPASDLEMLKFIELGHMKPTDMLWRDGFNEWRPATIVFPELQGAPSLSHTEAVDALIVGEPIVAAGPLHRRARSRKALVLALFLVIILGGAVSYTYVGPDWPLGKTVILLAQFLALQ